MCRVIRSETELHRELFSDLNVFLRELNQYRGVHGIHFY